MSRLGVIRNLTTRVKRLWNYSNIFMVNKRLAWITKVWPKYGVKKNQYIYSIIVYDRDIWYYIEFYKAGIMKISASMNDQLGREVHYPARRIFLQANDMKCVTKAFSVLNFEWLYTLMHSFVFEVE